MKEFDDGCRSRDVHSLLHYALKLVRELEDYGVEDFNIVENRVMIDIIEPLEGQLRIEKDEDLKRELGL